MRIPLRRALSISVAVLVTVLAVAFGGSGSLASWSRPLVYAHHGDTTVAPENTIAAIRAAVGWADGVEIDVHLAPDGSWRLSHDALAPGWQGLPTLPDAVAAAGKLQLDIDLKDASDEAHRRLAEWVDAAGIADRTSINVKSLTGARIISAIAPAVTIEAQPEWVPEAATAKEVDIVIVWGGDWRKVLKLRPAAQVGLFVNAISEPGVTRWAEALDARVGRYYSDGPPSTGTR